MDEVKTIKERCLKQPEKYLWKTTKEYDQIKNIFYHLLSLKYEDKPDYSYIRSELHLILERHISLDTPSRLLNSHKKISLKRKEEISAKKRIIKEKRKRIGNIKGDICKGLNKDESLNENLIPGKKHVDYKMGNNVKEINNHSPFEIQTKMNKPCDFNQRHSNLSNQFPKNIQFVSHPGLFSQMGHFGNINSLSQINSLNQINPMGFNPIIQMNPSNNVNQINQRGIPQSIIPIVPNFMVMNSFPNAINLSQNMFMPLINYPSYSQNIININQLNTSNPFFIPTIHSIQQQYNQDFNSQKPRNDPRIQLQNSSFKNDLFNMMNKFNAKFLPKLNIPKESDNQVNINIPNSDAQKLNHIEEKISIPQNNNITPEVIPDLNNYKLNEVENKFNN